MLLRLFPFLALLAAPIHAQSQCQGSAPCLLGDRSYHMLEPDDWDGVSPLPVLMHFHGWMRQGDLVVKHDRIAGATRRRGVLLLAPNGRNKTWDFWTNQTEDVAFAAAVLKDAATRYPIDPDRIYVSGYSYGGAMAWRYVCENGANVAALLAISGTLRQSETCPQKPGQVRHVHGRTDTVMDFPEGPGGDALFPVALWRKAFDCADARTTEEWRAVSFLTLTRTIWSNCARGGPVVLDLHPGGHFIPHGWIARQLDDLAGRPFQYP